MTGRKVKYTGENEMGKRAVRAYNKNKIRNLKQ